MKFDWTNPDTKVKKTYPANKKRFRNVRVWLLEGLVEHNIVGT